MPERPPVNTPDNPILIEPKRLMCPAHGEHLRANWPKGYAMVGLELSKAALASPDLIRELDPSWDGQDGPANFDVEKLNAITERRPLCYFVDDDTIRRVLRAGEILKVERCDLCGIPGDAGAYSVLMPEGKVETRIVCLECAIKAGHRLHAAHPDGGVWSA